MAGALGREVARFNAKYFGYLGYLNVFYALYVFFLIRRSSLQALESLLASLIAFLALLLVQALVLQRGMVGVILLDTLKVYIGLLGVWVCVFVMGVWACAILLPKIYTQAKWWVWQFCLQAPGRLKRAGAVLNSTLKDIFSPRPSPLKSWQDQNTLENPEKTSSQETFLEDEAQPPLKIKVSYYSKEQDKTYAQQVQLVPPGTPAPTSAYMDLVQQRRSLDEKTPQIQKDREIQPIKPLDLKDYQLPSTDLLNPISHATQNLDAHLMEQKSQQLLAKLRMFKIDGAVVNTHVGPMVSTFEFRPAAHVKVSRVLALADDLAMALCAPSVRIQAPIKGKDVMGIEMANAKSMPICLREILESEAFEQASPLALALGKDVMGRPYVSDLEALPHLLIAGTTGSGKSVGMHAMILSLLFKNTPAQLQLLMIDPKRVEFSAYADIPHLRAPIITNPQQAIEALENAVQEMECRYMLLSAKRVKNIESYNARAQEKGQGILPFLVIVVDELADLMLAGGKEVETPIIRIAQMGRASGLHLIIATQRPSVDVLTGTIKTNLPCKISFKVGSKVDSRVVLDADGAQSLLGKGDMLFTPPGTNTLVRLHGPYVAEEEIERVADFIRRSKP